MRGQLVLHQVMDRQVDAVGGSSVHANQRSRTLRMRSGRWSEMACDAALCSASGATTHTSPRGANVQGEGLAAPRRGRRRRWTPGCGWPSPLSCARKARRPAKRATLPSSSSMRSSWLYLATRSVRDAEPVLIWPQSSATTRSAMVTSSVSPLRWRHHRGVARPVGHPDGVEGLRERADLVHLHQDASWRRRPAMPRDRRSSW